MHVPRRHEHARSAQPPQHASGRALLSNGCVGSEKPVARKASHKDDDEIQSYRAAKIVKKTDTSTARLIVILEHAALETVKV